MQPIRRMVLMLGSPCTEHEKLFRHHRDLSAVLFSDDAGHLEECHVVMVSDANTILTGPSGAPMSLNVRAVCYCFSAAHPKTMTDILSVWVPWVGQNVPVPHSVCAVVTRMDLVQHDRVVQYGEGVVSLSDIESVCCAVNAFAVVVSSVRLGEGIVPLHISLSRAVFAKSPLNHMEQVANSSTLSEEYTRMAAVGKLSYDQNHLQLLHATASPLVKCLKGSEHALASDVRALVLAIRNRKVSAVSYAEDTLRDRLALEEAAEWENLFGAWWLQWYAMRMRVLEAQRASLKLEDEVLLSVDEERDLRLLHDNEVDLHVSMQFESEDLMHRLRSFELELLDTERLRKAAVRDIYRLDLETLDIALHDATAEVEDMEQERGLARTGSVYKYTSPDDVQCSLVRAIEWLDARTMSQMRTASAMAKDLHHLNRDVFQCEWERYLLHRYISLVRCDTRQELGHCPAGGAVVGAPWSEWFSSYLRVRCIANRWALDDTD